MTGIRCSTVSLGLCILALLAACGGSPQPDAAAKNTAKIRARASEKTEQYRRQRIQSIEADLVRLEQIVDRTRQQQQEQFNQVRDVSRQLLAELNELKLSMGMAAAPSTVKLPEVPDESTAVPAEKTVPATGSGGERGFGFFKRLLLLIVLLAAAYIIFKALNLWHEQDDDLDEDDAFENEESMVAAAPDAGRQPAPADPPPATDQPPADQPPPPRQD